MANFAKKSHFFERAFIAILLGIKSSIFFSEQGLFFYTPVKTWLQTYG